MRWIRHQLARRAFPLAAGCLLSLGCATTAIQTPMPSVQVGRLGTEVAVAESAHVPRELDKVTLPTYRVEPPDILLIEAVNNIRPPEDPLRAGDEVEIRVSGTFPPDPEADPIENSFNYINGTFLVESNGTVDLGPKYGAVPIAGLTVPEAEAAITRYLHDTVQLRAPLVSLTLPDVNGRQAITGEHLVRPDGTVSLGIYGSVRVAGMTLEQVRAAIEAHLAQFVHQPEVSVDVVAYNSKVYYVITDGGGFGEQVIRLPMTGNETVLDAIAQIQGLPEISSKKIWIARPAPTGSGCAQILQVDWNAIAASGVTTTNYQLLPGDRIYIEADHWIAFDNVVSKVTAPFERILGFILLGNGTVRSLQQGGRGFGSGVGGGVF